MKELKRISIIWGLLLFLIFSVLTFFGLQWKKKTEPYLKLENTLVEKTKSYYETNHSYPNRGEKVKITYNELKENNVYNELKMNDFECDGYVIVTNEGVINYKAYIKCQDYTSKDYDKMND